jgi:hypothetical protein
MATIMQLRYTKSSQPVLKCSTLTFLSKVRREKQSSGDEGLTVA